VTAVAVFGWLVLRGVRPGRILLALDRFVLDRRGRSSWRPSPDWTPTAPILVASVSTILALTIPHLWTVLGGGAIALTAGWIASRRRGWLPLGLLPGIVLAVLILLWSVRLTGPLGGWIPALIDGPFSPRAAQALALMTSGVVVAASGLWPVHGITIPVLLSPLAIAVSAYATLLLPDGVQFWQPLLAPVALVAMMHGVAQRRTGQVLVAAGVFGAWTGTREGTVGGALLVGAAWLMVVVPATWLSRLSPPRLLIRVAWLLPCWGAVLVLRGGVSTQIVYSMVAALTMAVAIAIWGSQGGAGLHPPVAPTDAADHI
jgi:hypothetical protein